MAAHNTQTPSAHFIPPSIDAPAILSGASYTYYSPIPPSLLAPSRSTGILRDQQSSSSSSAFSTAHANPANADDADDTTSSTAAAAATTATTATTTTTTTPAIVAATAATTVAPTATALTGTPCALGVDEAGRGPVLGPMVYGVFFLPLALSDPLLRKTHHFDDSKVLTPAVREALMRALCEDGSNLHASCGYAVSALSARDIGSGMLRPCTAATYNLNAQAMDATVELIRGVMARGVNVAEIYVDTVGPPAVYEQRLQRLFPSASVTVAKKADSLFPCVSAASVCAKVTRDKALEVLYRARSTVANTINRTEADDVDVDHGGGYQHDDDEKDEKEKYQTMAWGSGYPSDGKCVSWLRSNMHPVFGWGPECRFSWGTAKDMLEGNQNLKVEWPVEDDGETAHLTDYFASGSGGKDTDELGSWFGTSTGLQAF